MRHLFSTVIYVAIFTGIFYFAIWPVSIIPIAWEAPPNAGFTGDFAPNDRLAKIVQLNVKNHLGPEAVTFDDQGRIYTGVDNGLILRLDRNGNNPEVYGDTKGRPLAMDFDRDGNLIVADGIRGLIAIEPNGSVEVLTNQVIGRPIGFADDLVLTSDGKIYFTDASRKFSPQRYGGVRNAALLDLMEHGGSGRLLVYDTLTEDTDELITDLNFPNGLTLSHDGKSLLLTETGSYRVLRYWLEGQTREM